MSGATARVVRGGFLAIVVDRGRLGHRAQGVPTDGALDGVAFAIANVLAGNDAGAASIEIALGDVAVRFDGGARFAIAGADCAADLDGARVDAWCSYEARPGATLTLRRPRAGARSYLAIAGGIEVPRVLDSRTTNLAAAFGGLDGRALRDGDRLAIGDERIRTFARGARPRCKPPQWDFARASYEGTVLPVRLLTGGEYALVDDAMRAQLWSDAYAVTPQSDRMGLRLSGTASLELSCPERRSHAVFAGVVQLPPSGEPIVLLAGAQATGGYPKLGAVVEADLWKLAQLPIGGRLRFVESSYAQAAEARGEIAAYVERVKAALP